MFRLNLKFCLMFSTFTAGDTLYYKFMSDMSNTEWGYMFTVTGGHRGRFQTGDLKRISIFFFNLFEANSLLCGLLLVSHQALRSSSRCLPTRVCSVTCRWQTSGSGKWVWPVVRPGISDLKPSTYCSACCSVSPRRKSSFVWTFPCRSQVSFILTKAGRNALYSPPGGFA